MVFYYWEKLSASVWFLRTKWFIESLDLFIVYSLEAMFSAVEVPKSDKLAHLVRARCSRLCAQLELACCSDARAPAFRKASNGTSPTIHLLCLASQSGDLRGLLRAYVPFIIDESCNLLHLTMAVSFSEDFLH